jgi:uncharacterized membrane protein
MCHPGAIAMSAASLSPNDPAGFVRRHDWGAFLLGFGLGGFFDGILLHQVLQWHHLLSAVSGEAFRDIRVQILADGLFHVLMYVLVAAGLWLLWRTPRQQAARSSGGRLFAHALLGFGVWNIVDAALFHWLLGLHRIRMDVDNPLFWDLLWFFVFGVLFVGLGWWLRGRQPTDSGAGAGGHRLRAPVVLTVAAVVGGAVAALPPPGVTSYMVLFKPGTTPAQAIAALDHVDGRLMWSDRSGQLLAVDLGTGGRPAELYRHGAMLVSNSLLPVGCFNWMRI